MWNEARLAELALKSFKKSKLIIVSNRAPYIHQQDEGRVVCISPAGGLTAALKPIVAAARGTWVAQASGSADRETASTRGRVSVPPDDPTFTLRRIWIPEDLQSAYYEGMANQALWPLCHNVYHRPVFRESDWCAYKRVNELFAKGILDEAGDQEAVVFIQDYHLALLPRILKARNPALTVAQFWHIPWPHAETVQTFPWIDELLDGMLGNDLLGFHLSQHCKNFLDIVETELAAEAETDRLHNTIWCGGHATTIRDAPISIDFERHTQTAASVEVTHAMHRWKRLLGKPVRVGIGIDRMDYTKGIPERLRSIRMLFERNRDLRGNFTFVQVAVPSRSGIPEYSELESTIDAEVAAINDRWGTFEWQPVILEKRNLPPVEMMALHRIADVCLVTSLHDGMNLVAKEFVASRFDGDGVLILSRFAGAAHELKTALQVNPFSEACIYTALVTALTMQKRERERRMSEARRVVETNNVYRWAGKLIEEIEEIRRATCLSTANHPFQTTGGERRFAVAI